MTAERDRLAAVLGQLCSTCDCPVGYHVGYSHSRTVSPGS